jgi:hypothetical protein
MEALEEQLDALDAKLQHRQSQSPSEYGSIGLSADLRRSATYVRERVNNLLRDLVIEEKLQVPPRRLPKTVIKQLGEEFLDLKAFVDRGAHRVNALETRFFIQQKNIRQGKPLGEEDNPGLSLGPKPTKQAW